MVKKCRGRGKASEITLIRSFLLCNSENLSNLLQTCSPPCSRRIVEVGSLLLVRLSWVKSSVLVADKVLVCCGGGRGVMEAFTGYDDFVNISSTLLRNVP